MQDRHILLEQLKPDSGADWAALVDSSLLLSLAAVFKSNSLTATSAASLQTSAQSAYMCSCPSEPHPADAFCAQDCCSHCMAQPSAGKYFGGMCLRTCADPHGLPSYIEQC